jgi:hypothetical protein
MHNCKLTRSSLTDLAMGPMLNQQLLDELRECPACYEEYAAIRDVLRASSLALRATVPSEEFWSGYHSRLVNRIENYSPTAPRTQLSRLSAAWRGMRNVATSSLRVPVPLVATAVLLLLGVSTLLIRQQQQRQLIVPPGQSTAVITKTLEVPVIKEKVVTRVVYVEKNRNRSRNVPDQLNVAQAADAGTRVAQVAPDASVTPSLSLIGFKPTEQVKLKVMKGSYRDEQ